MIFATSFLYYTDFAIRKTDIFLYKWKKIIKINQRMLSKSQSYIYTNIVRLTSTPLLKCITFRNIFQPTFCLWVSLSFIYFLMRQRFGLNSKCNSLIKTVFIFTEWCFNHDSVLQDYIVPGITLANEVKFSCEPSPRCRINWWTCRPAVQFCITVLRLSPI